METQAAAATLPDDLLTGVHGRVPAHGVSKFGHDLVDEHHLPHSVRGLFINYQDYHRCHFLSRPTPTTSPPEFDGGPRRIDGEFGFVQRERAHTWYEVLDHCNGLVLFLESDDEVLHVCNPGTRWSARLPPCRACRNNGASLFLGHRRVFLVFDPLVSPEYKVLLSPVEPEEEEVEKDDVCRLMEWPPSAWTAWHEFSSGTGRWEEKTFVREGEAAGTAGDLLLKKDWAFYPVQRPWRYATYWQGALYIHCYGEYVSRFCLVDNKYRVIKSPIPLAEGENHGVRSFLGRSEKGVYIAAIARKALPQLRVWTLSESDGHMEWVPMDQSNLEINTSSWRLENNKFDEQKYWILDHDDGRKNQVSLVEQNVCWDSDDDNIVDVSDDDNLDDLPYLIFLGFHPYKEVIFLSSDRTDCVAFHLNSPKVQYLGKVQLINTYNRGIRESFVYTPCSVGDCS